jgi:hypothetical protein
MPSRHAPTEPTHRFPPDSCPHIDRVLGWHRENLSESRCQELCDELEAVRTINFTLRNLAGDWKEWAEHQYERANEAEKKAQHWENEHDYIRDRQLEPLQRKHDQLEAELADLQEQLRNVIST